MKPTIFDGLPVHAAASTLRDGVMSFGLSESDETVAANRERWLMSQGVAMERATLLRTMYADDVTYDRIADAAKADEGKGMRSLKDAIVCDAMFTKAPGQALFLPLADCGGIVAYDASQKILGLLHLGRHATFADLAAKAIEHMKGRYSTNPRDLWVWISPSISGESYKLTNFAFAEHPEWQPFAAKQTDGWWVDLQAYNIAAFQKAGVPLEQIEHAEVDTATHPDYPSHFQFATHGESHKAGRFAVGAWMEA